MSLLCSFGINSPLDPGTPAEARRFTPGGFFLRGLCAPRYAEVIMLCCAERGAWRATNGGPKRLIPSKSDVEGVKAHDDFTSSVLGNDVILDAKRRVAGISDLARWNWCR